MAPDTDSGTRACKIHLDCDTGSGNRVKTGERQVRGEERSSLDTGLTVDNCQAPVKRVYTPRLSPAIHMSV